MKILHVIENCDDRYGGPAKTIPQLCIYLNQHGIHSEIHSVKHYSEETNTLLSAWPHIWKNHRNTIHDTMRFSPDLFASLNTAILQNNTIIHTHNQWNYPAWCAYRCSKNNRIPLVHSLLGSLDFIDYYLIKKFLWYAFQKKMLNSCSCIHITKKDDLECIRKLGINTPIALIPDGVDISEFKNMPEKNEARNTLHISHDGKIMLYLARIHPQKGIVELLKSFESVASDYPEWNLCVAGPCEDQDFLKRLKNQISNAGLTERIFFTGMLNRQQCLSAYASADAFILPSRSENFGVSIAEALVSELPVIATRGAPWRDLEDYRCGFWVNFSEKDFACALRKMMTLSNEERKEMGQRGKLLVQKKYDQNFLMENYILLYDWILKQTSKPECVYL